MSQPTSPVRVAVVQFDPQVGLDNRESNLHRSLALAAEAVNGGANLIVLPELSNCGYFFSSRQDAFEHAEPVPGGASVQAWMAFAATHQVYLVAGLNEIEGRQLFNTAVLLGPDGLIGKYRKAHLWNLEKLWFTPGNLGFPVFETPIGRIGLLICWDIWFPEVPRILSQQGADIICSLNNWVWTPPPLFDEAANNIGALLAEDPWHFREPDVPADQQANPSNRRFKHRKAQVAGSEPEFFQVPQMGLAVLADQPIRAQQQCSVEQLPAIDLIQARHQIHLVRGRKRHPGLHTGPARNNLGMLECILATVEEVAAVR